MCLKKTGYCRQMYKALNFIFRHCLEYVSPCSTREVAFGVETGRIADSQITSSSAYAGLEAVQGRLNGAASWSAAVLNKDQWVQIDLGRDEVVTAIATQGRANADQWVKSYSVSYSLDGKVFVSYKTKDIVKASKIVKAFNQLPSNVGSNGKTFLIFQFQNHPQRYEKLDSY